MAKAAPQIELTQEQIETLQAWNAEKNALDLHKDAEIAKRLEVAKTLPFKADKEEGSQTISLNAGWKLTLTRTMSYSMETKNNEAVLAALGKLHATSPEKAAHLVTRWEPVMSVEVYKSLTDEEKKIVADVVTIKPGTPQLALKPPTEPKA